MLSKLYTATLLGLECKIVEVEVDYRRGTAFFAIVGLADKSVQEAKERVPAAIKNSGASYIPMQIVINLAPAELSKTGSSYDLPLAMGYLIASEQINFNPHKKLFIGELALDGKLRPVHGVFPIVDSAKKLGFEEIYLPIENADEASMVGGIKIYGINYLRELINHFKNQDELEQHISNPKQEREIFYSFDFSQVKGQDYAKRAMEIAAAGGHNILMSGSPGSGKTLLSKCLPSILPEMTITESLEVTKIYSVAGLTSSENPLIRIRPFRSPHHTSSQIALVGGGPIPRPGEISLSHRGILFLDEFPEFSSQALESLRQPLEDKLITISRAQASLTFPANFILVAAMNPCKCGYRGDPSRICICTQHQVMQYQKKISGPILDRIDLLVKVTKVENTKLYSSMPIECSESIRGRVQEARNMQLERFNELKIFSNSEMNQKNIENFIVLDSPTGKLLKMAVDRMGLTARSYFRILRVSRTIADLEGAQNIEEKHVAEALSYRVEIT